MVAFEEMEQNFTAPSLHACARSKQVQLPLQAFPGQQDLGLHRLMAPTATRSHGPRSSDDNRNTRRRLDTFSNPDEENARSAVPLHFPCEQFFTGMSTWISKFLATTNMLAPNMPIKTHCKTGSKSACLVFETRAKCQDFVALFRVDGLTASYCKSSAVMLVRQSKSPEDRRNREAFLHRFVRFWQTNYKNISPVMMPKVISLFQVSMYEHRSSAYTIAETELGNWCSDLLHLDTNNCSMSLLLICVNLTFLMLCCNRLLVKQALRLRIARPCVMAAFSPWRVEALVFFAAFHVGGLCYLHFICADVFPCVTKSLVVGKALKHKAVVRVALRLALFIPPFGLAKVNP